jgi:1-acyl-sn-glycerol-3-phosphate acyltransferase
VTDPPHVTPAFRGVMAAASPVVRVWGRLEVSGLEHMPSWGPTLLAGNHDSWWDPVVIGTAALPRRQIQALAKASLWKNGIMAKVLDGMGQIPIDRGKGDAGALDRAIAELRAGACIGIFLEGTRSGGQPLRARSGFGRIAQGVPEAQIVCVAVQGAVDLVRFPRRAHLRVRFFTPAGGGLAEGESAAELTARLLAEIRAAAPVTPYGRRPGARERQAVR